MAETTNVFLGVDNTAPGFDNAAYFGNSGTESVTFTDDSASTSIDQNIEGVAFAGSVADYLFQQQGNTLRVFSGTTLITTVVIQDDANGTQLTFAEGTTTAKLNGPQLELGETPVPSDEPDSVQPGDLEPTEPTNPGETIDLSVTADDLTGTDGDDTFRARVVQNPLGEQTNQLGTGDQLDGGAGIDTLAANVQDASPLNSDPNGSIAPETVDVEIAHFNADANYSDFDDDDSLGVEINAADMIGLDEVGSVNSDTSLIIYDVNTLRDDGVYTNRRETEAVAVTMDHTGNNSPVQDEADLIVLFDQNYLLAAPVGEADSSLTLQLLDIDNQINTNQPLKTNPFDTLRFTITVDGVTTQYDIKYDSMNDLTGLASYQALADSINDALDDKGLTDLTAIVDGEFSVVDPDNDPGTPSNPAEGFNIIITNAGEGTLAAVGFLATGVVPPNTDYQKQVFPTPPQETPEFVTVDINLDKVGRNSFAEDGNGGGDLIVGGMATNLDNVLGEGSPGVQQFDVTVRGDSSEPSSLSSLQSTNNSLERVFIESAPGTNAENAADLYIGNHNSSEGENGALAQSAGLFPISNPFDVTTVMNNALKDVVRLDSTGNNDQDVGAFVGDLNVHAYISDEFLEKYLDVTDGQPDSGADDVDAVYTTGVGDDLVNVNIDKSNFVSLGSATRDDFSFSTFTNEGNDHVQIQIGNGFNINPLQDPDDPDADEALYNTQNWYQNHVLADNLNVSTGTGDDFVELWGATAARVDLGDGDDAIYTDNSGVVEFFDPEFQDANLIQSAYHATWVFNAENTGILDLRSQQGFAVNNVANLTLTVTFQGIEVTVDVGATRNAANGATVTDLTINQAIKAAINDAVNSAFAADPQPFNATNPLSKMLVAEDGPGRTLIVRSLIDGQNVVDDLSISLGTSGPLVGAQTSPTSLATLLDELSPTQLATLGFTVAGAGVGAVGTPVLDTDPNDSRWDSQFATVTNTGTAMSGNDSFNVNNNIVEGNTGNDVIVLSSNGGSVETIDIDGAFGNDTIMNFTASIGDAPVPEVQTLVVTGPATGDGSINITVMGADGTTGTPIGPIAVTAGDSADVIADAIQTALEAAAAGNYTVARTPAGDAGDSFTFTLTDADGDTVYNEFNADVTITGGNEVQTITFTGASAADIAVGESVTVNFGGETATYTLTDADLTAAGGTGNEAAAVAAGLDAAFDAQGLGDGFAEAAGAVLTLTALTDDDIPSASVTTDSNIDYEVVETTPGVPLGFTVVADSVDGAAPATGYDIFDLSDVGVGGINTPPGGFLNDITDGSEEADLLTMNLATNNVFVIDQVLADDTSAADTAATPEALKIQTILRTIDTADVAGPNSVVITVDENDTNLGRFYLVENGAGADNLNVSFLGSAELGDYGTFPEGTPGPGDLGFKNGIGQWDQMSEINFTPLSRNALVDTFEAYNFIF